MTDNTRPLPVVAFACSTALNRLPSLGEQTSVQVKRVACAGAINAGMILQAIEQGAERVLVLACAEDACRHQTGAQSAQVQVELCRQLLHNLGLDPGIVALEMVSRTGESCSVLATDTEAR